MSVAAVGFVLDASVLAKLFVNEQDSDRTRALLSLWSAIPGVVLTAPDLVLAEVANVLRTHVRWHGLTIDLAATYLRMLLDFDLDLVRTATLVEPALAVALALDIAVYDASYLALASRSGLPLVTSDEKLVRKAVPAGHPAVCLGDWAPPENAA